MAHTKKNAPSVCILAIVIGMTFVSMLAEMPGDRKVLSLTLPRWNPYVVANTCHF